MRSNEQKTNLFKQPFFSYEICKLNLYESIPKA